MNIGAEMRARRTLLGYSLRSFAKKLNISAPYLSDLERGNRNYTAELQCKSEELLCPAGHNARIEKCEGLVHQTSTLLKRARSDTTKAKLMWELAWLHLRDLEDFRTPDGFKVLQENRETPLSPAS